MAFGFDETKQRVHREQKLQEADVSAPEPEAADDAGQPAVGNDEEFHGKTRPGTGPGLEQSAGAGAGAQT